MKLDQIFVSYENSGKLFPSYEKAYFHGKTIGKEKTVYYIFTPTGERCKRVGELERVARRYFNKSFDCDFILGSTFYKQLKIGDF